MMYTVTFYSYKGGVGRTMALVNSALSIAKSGKRVLVVDFDLEAPGLPSYDPFRCAANRPGIVDYITSYKATGVAPEAGEYIVECDQDDAKLWVMPAGRHTEPGYNDQLNSIDWQDLYDNFEGFLLMEDLKQQWSSYQGVGFDYVLIDSRTGHTDVGGICTRQLPDAVAVMFLPNDQNIDGLVPIVSSIKGEKRAGRNIKLHFVPSNVPDLDDEKEILLNLLKSAKDKLGYDAAAGTIRHYSSLDLLRQSAFTVIRPNSMLSRQYEELKMAIIAGNFTDRDGAIATLEKMPQQYDRARVRQKEKILDEIAQDAGEIWNLYQGDGQIAWLVSRVFAKMGNVQEEIDALGVAIETGHEVNQARFQRAATLAMISEKSLAIDDLLEVVSSPTASQFELRPALQLLAHLSDDIAASLEAPFARDDLDASTLVLMSTWLSMRREELPRVALRMEALSALTHSSVATNAAALAYIGSGDFERAKLLIGADRENLDKARMSDVFNYAIIEWAETGKAPRELFSRVASMVSPKLRLTTVNEHQCYALTHWVLDNRDRALAEIRAARQRIGQGAPIFSCWRYLYVSGDGMNADLSEMADLIEGAASPNLPFFQEIQRSIH